MAQNSFTSQYLKLRNNDPVLSKQSVPVSTEKETTVQASKRPVSALGQYLEFQKEREATKQERSNAGGGGFGGQQNTYTNGFTGNRESGGYSVAKGLAGVAQKGLGQIAQAGANTAALVEDIAWAPFEFFSGVPLGTISDNNGIANFIQQKVSKENAAIQQKYQENTLKGGKKAEVLENLGTATVAAVPQAVIALLTGGGSAAAQTTAGLTSTAAQAISPTVSGTVTNAISSMAQNPQYWTSFSQVVGNSYEDALADGASREQAVFNAIGNGLLNAAVEVGGGIETLPGELKNGSNAWKTWVKSALDEGKEEVVQGVIEKAVQNLTYNKNNPLASLTDENALFSPTRAAEEFTGGAVVGGILGGGQILANQIATNIANRPQVQQETVQPQAQEAAQVAQTQDRYTGVPQSENAVQSVTAPVQEDIMAHEAQRLFGNETQVQQATEEAPTDPLLSILQGNKRVPQLQLDESQIDRLGQLWEEGKAGLDSAGNVFEADPANHIDNRTYESAADRSTNAFQFDWPELQPYMKQAAEDLMATADISKNAGSTRRSTRTTTGKQYTQNILETPDLRSAMNMGLTRDQISLAAANLIADKGQENYAAAKRLELVLDEMLTTGYTTVEGQYVPPNQAYIEAKSRIAGAKPVDTYGNISEELPIWDNPVATPSNQERYDNLGSAKEGFTGAGMEGVERTSRLADSMPYNKYQEAATALSREDYAKLFRYQSQTEARSMNLAEELLYYMQDGKRTFLKDIDENAFQELVKSLDDAPAWNAPMVDAAKMIQSELQGRSANMEITSDEYVDFLRIMREHETATGQGVQANAKWTRANNDAGQSSELDAWENLEQSNLTDQEKAEVFNRIVKWDNNIEQVQYGDTQSMKNIILEVAQERGTLSGLSGRQSRILYALADKSLNSMTFDQLKQFAYASTSALSTDSTPVNLGRKIKTIQVLNMLSNPITAARNIAGNTSFYGIDALSMRGAALLDMALSNITGTRSVALEKFALSSDARNSAVKAMQMAIAEITMDVDMSADASRYGTSSNRTFKASGNFAERVLSALERNQAYLLNATDELYKGAARSTQQQTQSLIDQGKIRTSDKNYAKNQAEQLAKYRTFQDDSTIATAIQQIHDVLNLAGIGDSGKTIKGKTVHSFGAGDIIAPFTRVAGNLVSRGVEYSPINAAKGAVEIGKVIANSARNIDVDPATQAKALSDFARGMTGTAIAYGFMALAKAGLLRQAEDENDPNVQAMNQSEGIQGTQFNISAAERWLNGESGQWQNGDTLVDLSSIQPLNLLMNLGTEMAKNEGSPFVSMYTSLDDSLMDAAAELPVLQSVGNMATDIIKYGQDPKEVFLEEAANTVVSSVTPNLLRGIAKAIDDRPRNTYAGDTLLDNIVSNIKNSIPGVRETLPGSVNPMGEEKTYGKSAAQQFVDSLINPVGVNTYNQSTVSQELQRLRGQTGETSFYPTKSIPTSLSYTKDDKTYEKQLTYEQRQEFQKERGSIANNVMGDMINSSAYKSASNEKKANLLNRCQDYAYEIAKENAMGMQTAPEWVHNAQNAANDLGISTERYLAYYEQYGSALSGSSYENVKEAVKNGLTIPEYMEYKDSVSGLTSDKDENGKTISGSKKEKVLSAINEMDLSDTEKDWLYYLNGYSESTISDSPWHK